MRRMDAVLRLLKSEDLDSLSRKLKVNAATLSLSQEGQATVLFAMDHHTSELLGIHAATRVTRWEALEPVRQRYSGALAVSNETSLAGSTFA